MDLIWYRFKTKAVDDCRPLIDMKSIQMPWWCTGYAMDDSYAIIVCYLPKGEDLTQSDSKSLNGYKNGVLLKCKHRNFRRLESAN